MNYLNMTNAQKASESIYKKSVELEEENARLKECVEFYASDDTYISGSLEMDINSDYCEPTGTKARACLNVT